MSTDTCIVMRLEVDRNAEPIAGTLFSPSHEECPFTGWLGLTDAIEQIRDAHPGTRRRGEALPDPER